MHPAICIDKGLAHPSSNKITLTAYVNKDSDLPTDIM